MCADMADTKAETLHPVQLAQLAKEADVNVHEGQKGFGLAELKGFQSWVTTVQSTRIKAFFNLVKTNPEGTTELNPESGSLSNPKEIIDAKADTWISKWHSGKPLGSELFPLQQEARGRALE